MTAVSRSLRARAEEYAALLDVGSEIIDDTDGPVVAPFRHLLDGLLFLRKRLYLERRGDREVVTATPPWRRRPQDEPRVDLADSIRDALGATVRTNRVSCRKCSTPFFDCEHEAMLILGAPVQPTRAIPWLGEKPREWGRA